MDLKETIFSFVKDSVRDTGRSDILREPLLAYSAADDERYTQLKSLVGPWHMTPGELLPGAQSVISIFVPFSKNVLAAAKADEPVSALWGEAYVVLNALYDSLGKGLADMLGDMGYPSVNIASTHTYDPKELKSMWSHRSAAVIAGLGSFGLNRLLITEKGSGGRFCSVITSARLQPSPSPAPLRCIYYKSGGCRLCLKACPIEALGDGEFKRFNCSDRLFSNGRFLGNDEYDVCGKCIAACPLSYIE